MKNFLFSLAPIAIGVAALAAACATPDSPPVLAMPACPTPSECPFITFDCDLADSTQLVWLDFEPSPWGPDLIACCPLFPEKAPAFCAPICAVLDTTLQPWQLRVWSDSVTLFAEDDITPPYFCMDEYWGNFYAHFDGDTLKIDLRNYEQVRHYLDTQEQIQFVVEIHCPD